MLRVTIELPGDYHAKLALWEAVDQQEMLTKPFPLEPICVCLGRNKLTSDKGATLQFWAHKQLAKECFHDARILFEEFNLVDWEAAHMALHSVPRLFQI
jgi:hypothetical protein